MGMHTSGRSMNRVKEVLVVDHPNLAKGRFGIICRYKKDGSVKLRSAPKRISQR